MKKIKYMVTDDFANNNIGDILDAYLLFEFDHEGLGLVYHPKSKGECASVSVCREVEAWEVNEDGTTNVWVEMLPGCLYKNFSSQEEINRAFKDIRYNMNTSDDAKRKREIEKARALLASIGELKQ